jgi:hypothetical protein
MRKFLALLLLLVIVPSARAQQLVATTPMPFTPDDCSTVTITYYYDPEYPNYMGSPADPCCPCSLVPATIPAIVIEATISNGCQSFPVYGAVKVGPQAVDPTLCPVGPQGGITNPWISLPAGYADRKALFNEYLNSINNIGLAHCPPPDIAIAPAPPLNLLQPNDPISDTWWD